jgi:hypothetical protein
MLPSVCPSVCSSETKSPYGTSPPGLREVTEELAVLNNILADILAKIATLRLSDAARSEAVERPPTAT